MADKALGGCASIQVPQAESAVPRARQSKLTIGGDGNVLDVVAVTAQALLHHTVTLVAAGNGPENNNTENQDKLMRSAEGDSLSNLFLSLRYHTMMDLSREADSTMSGASTVVAMAVTQPPCPFRSPFHSNCSLLD